MRSLWVPKDPLCTTFLYGEISDPKQVQCFVGQKSQTSHSVHRGSLYDVTSCLAAWSHVPSGCLGVFVSYPMFLPGRWLGGSLSRGVSVSGGLFRGLCPGVSVQERVSVVSVQQGSLSSGGLFVQGGLCPGEISFPGVSVGGGAICPRRSLSYGKEWMVCILLECILVRSRHRQRIAGDKSVNHTPPPS